MASTFKSVVKKALSASDRTKQSGTELQAPTKANGMKKREVLIQWLSDPLSQREVEKQYPDRRVAPPGHVAGSYAPCGANQEQVNAAYVAMHGAHYSAVRILHKGKQPFEVQLGDDVEVDAPEGHPTPTFIMRVTELFKDVKGDSYMCGDQYHWPEETVMVSFDEDGKPYFQKTQPERRVFLATKREAAKFVTVQPLPAVRRKVTVSKVAPGMEPPTIHVCDFWYDQSHEEFMWTFRDLPINETRPDVDLSDLGEDAGLTSEEVVHLGMTHPLIRDGTVKDEQELHVLPGRRKYSRVFNVLELCGGVGGLSGVVPRLADLGNGRGVVRGEPKWCVDIDQSACATYQVNHPRTFVMCTGIDEVTMLSKLFVDVLNSFEVPIAIPNPHGDAVAEPMDDEEGGAGPSTSAPAKRPAWLPLVEIGSAVDYYSDESDGEKEDAGSPGGQPSARGRKAGRRSKGKVSGTPRRAALSAKALACALVGVDHCWLDDCAPRWSTGQGRGQLINELEKSACWILYRCVLRTGSAVTAVLRAFEPSPVPARNIPNSELKVEGEGVQKGLDPQQAAKHKSEVDAKKRDLAHKWGEEHTAEVKRLHAEDAARLREQLITAMEQDARGEGVASPSGTAATGGADTEMGDEQAGPSKGSGKGKGKAGGAGGRPDPSMRPRPQLADGQVHLELPDYLVAVLREVVPGAEEVMRASVTRLVRRDAVPLPGRVHMMMGGPPCQGLSGLNRHSAYKDILSDPKNRLIKAYFEMVEWFKPQYTLTEQVMDMFKKEHARYARFMACALAAMRYQSRFSVLAAGEFGSIQTRFRTFVWGAAPGVVLPSAPEPTHRAYKLGDSALPLVAKMCRTGFLSPESRAAAHPPHLLGDILGDLPEVDNFCLSDACAYKCDPKTPYQLYLRRGPPAGTPSLEERCVAADVLMQKVRNDFLRKILDTYEEQGEMGVGYLFKCNKKLGSSKEGSKAAAEDGVEVRPPAADDRLGEDEDEVLQINEVAEGNYVSQTWEKLKDELVGNDPEARALLDEDRDRTRDAHFQHLGAIVMEQVRKALELGKKPVNELPLRDHRPLMCNADDQLRMAAVPNLKRACFRQFAGVVQNVDGTCCAGHFHAYKVEKKDKKTGVTSILCNCKGGGHTMKPKSSQHKSSRIDQHDKKGWRGTKLDRCEAWTAWLPTGDLLCPRWCITYGGGKSGYVKDPDADGQRHSCFGRIWHDEHQPTVVTRSEPHNLRLVHPEQDRVLTIRENARCAGFSDHTVLVGLGSGSRNDTASVPTRYKQMGNAVCPLVADAWSRCLVYAWRRGTTRDEDQPIIRVPDPDMDEAYEKAAELKPQLKAYAVTCGTDRPDMGELVGARMGKGSAAASKAAARKPRAAATSDDGDDGAGPSVPAVGRKRGAAAAKSAPAAKRAKAAAPAAAAPASAAAEPKRRGRPAKAADAADATSPQPAAPVSPAPASAGPLSSPLRSPLARGGLRAAHAPSPAQPAAASGQAAGAAAMQQDGALLGEEEEDGVSGGGEEEEEDQVATGSEEEEEEEDQVATGSEEEDEGSGSEGEEEDDGAAADEEGGGNSPVYVDDSDDEEEAGSEEGEEEEGSIDLVSSSDDDEEEGEGESGDEEEEGDGSEVEEEEEDDEEEEEEDE